MLTLREQQPLLHALIALIQITMVSILVRKFNAYYQNRPVLTTMITNAVRFLHFDFGGVSTAT